MKSTASIVANQQWREQEGLEPDPTVSMGEQPEARGERAAPVTPMPHARLADMDADGVEVSSSYCEVSSFRYLYLIENGWKESTRAFNSALAEFASVDPKRLIVSYQIPIHDIDAAVDEVRWAASVGCKSLQLPVFPAELGLPDYWEQRYAPLWAAIQDTELPICCHIGMNTQLDDLARRDPTPQKGIFVPMVPLSAAEALGMWIMGGVFEHFPRLKVVFVEPGLGWVSWWLYIVDDLNSRQGYDFPAISELPSHYFRQNVYLTFIDEPTRSGTPTTGSASRTSCGRRTTRTRCRAGRTRVHSSRRCSTAYPTTSASSSSAATPRASGTSERAAAAVGGDGSGLGVDLREYLADDLRRLVRGQLLATLGFGHLVGERLDRRVAADEHVPQRFGARGRIVERLDRLRHVLGVLGHRVDDRHGLLATRRGRHRVTTRRILLEVPLRERFVVATLTGAQRHRGGIRLHLCLGIGVVVVRVTIGRDRDGQRTVVVPDDVHARHRSQRYVHRLPTGVPPSTRVPSRP